MPIAGVRAMQRILAAGVAETDVRHTPNIASYAAEMQTL